MEPNVSMHCEPKVNVDRWSTTTSDHFYRRARHYWLAAAVTDSPRDAKMFSDLGTMFDRLARDFKRLETDGTPLKDKDRSGPRTRPDIAFNSSETCEPAPDR